MQRHFEHLHEPILKSQSLGSVEVESEGGTGLKFLKGVSVCEG